MEKAKLIRRYLTEKVMSEYERELIQAGALGQVPSEAHATEF